MGQPISPECHCHLATQGGTVTTLINLGKTLVFVACCLWLAYEIRETFTED